MAQHGAGRASPPGEGVRSGRAELGRPSSGPVREIETDVEDTACTPAVAGGLRTDVPARRLRARSTTAWRSQETRPGAADAEAPRPSPKCRRGRADQPFRTTTRETI